MSQYKKEDIKEKIDNAALKVFAEKGYEAAKISDISKESNVSVGNIYKYYRSKEEIFYSVVPESFMEELKALIESKIVAWKEDDKKLESNILLNEKLSELIVENKEKIIILFCSCKNTKYESLREEIINLLASLVSSNYEIKDAENVNDENKLLLLKAIFESLLNMISKMLLKNKDIKDLSEVLSIINKYHTFGITGIIKNYE